MTDRTRRELLADAGRASVAGTLLAPIAVAAAQGASTAQAVPAPDLPTTSGWTNDDYWAFADWALTAADEEWDESIGFYGADIRTSCAMLSAHSIAAQLTTRAARRATTSRAKRMAEPARAGAAVPACARRRQHRRDQPALLLAVAHPGLDRLADVQQAGPARLDRPESRGGAVAGVDRPRHDRALLADCVADRRPHPGDGRGRVLQVPEHAAEPGQLVPGALRVGGGDRRRPAEVAAGVPQPAHALVHGRNPEAGPLGDPEPEPELELPSRPAVGRRQPAEHRVQRVLRASSSTHSATCPKRSSTGCSSARSRSAC